MTPHLRDAMNEQRRPVLTAHPLQRIGALALAQLAGVRTLDDMTPERFEDAVGKMAGDAAQAGWVASTKDVGGFWLKASGSFFPNSKMNHPSRARKSKAQITDEVLAWRRIPEGEAWPDVPCALCGRQACGFYGKMDVMLAASVAYRNTTPPGHHGLAMCFSCLCCFYALPYGSVLTGGPSVAVHSWDDAFLRHVTQDQVDATRRRLTVEVAPLGPSGRELVALQALRGYDHELRAGVELMVFSNNNQDQSLAASRLDEPLAEWLRSTMTRSALRSGFHALLRAHRSGDRSGSRRLARNAFHNPRAILTTAVDHVRANRMFPLPPACTPLITLCRSYATKVIGLNQSDVSEVENVAAKVARILSQTPEPGPLQTFRVRHRKVADLRNWFKVRSAEWTLGRHASSDNGNAHPTGPLITTRQWRLLFDPAEEEAWAYRELLLIAVLEHLDKLQWRPTTDAAASADDGDRGEQADDQGMADEELGDWIADTDRHHTDKDENEGDR